MGDLISEQTDIIYEQRSEISNLKDHVNCLKLVVAGKDAEIYTLQKALDNLKGAIDGFKDNVVVELQKEYKCWTGLQLDMRIR